MMKALALACLLWATPLAAQTFIPVDQIHLQITTESGQLQAETIVMVDRAINGTCQFLWSEIRVTTDRVYNPGVTYVSNPDKSEAACKIDIRAYVNAIPLPAAQIPVGFVTRYRFMSNGVAGEWSDPSVPFYRVSTAPPAKPSHISINAEPQQP